MAKFDPTSVVKIKKAARIERYKNDFEDNKETIKQPILQLNLSKQNIYSEQKIKSCEKIIILSIELRNGKKYQDFRYWIDRDNI